MIPWILLDKTPAPEKGEELKLYQRDSEYVIKTGTSVLMNSRIHGSEDALGSLACQKIKAKREQRILIGGLGMGFTLRAALNSLKPKDHVIVAELVPAVVRWNHEFLGFLAENPLNDNRVSVYEGDVADKIIASRGLYHAILLDVDNGSVGLTQNKNDNLYTNRGLKAAYAALQSQGVLAVWSAGPDEAFTKRLEKANFKVEEVRVRARSGGKGGRVIVWIARKKKGVDK